MVYELHLPGFCYQRVFVCKAELILLASDNGYKAAIKLDSSGFWHGRTRTLHLLGLQTGSHWAMSVKSNMYEQLRAVWRTKSKGQPFVRGFLKINNSSSHPLNETLSSEEAVADVLDRWFTVLGHCLFYCMHRDSEDFSGALLTHLFSPIIARVDEKTQESFQATATQQVTILFW